MEKIRRTSEEYLQWGLVFEKLDEICDWISTHDERMAKAKELLDELAPTELYGKSPMVVPRHDVQPLCKKCNHSCKQYGGCMIESCDSYDGSILSELEAGLKKMDDGKWWHDTDKPCTYIILPMAQYEEYDEDDMGDVPGLLVFHDIPVYGLPIDRIIYGTD